jgi:hypothetical protein
VLGAEIGHDGLDETGKAMRDERKAPSRAGANAGRHRAPAQSVPQRSRFSAFFCPPYNRCPPFSCVLLLLFLSG